MIDPVLARRIRLLGLDVDGVLTDNGIFVGPVDGQVVELKRFDIQDGLGHVMMRIAGLPVIWLSGRHSEATSARARELRVEEVLQVAGPRKLEAFGALLERRGIGWDEAAFVGDDLADLQVLRRVGLPMAVATARCGRWRRRFSRRAGSGPSCSSASSPSRRRVPFDTAELIALGRRVLD